MVPALALLIAQQGGLYERVVPTTTGHNGYEEYVRAAELLSTDVGRAYATYEGPTTAPQSASPETSALYRRLSKMAPLDVAREALTKYGAVLTLVEVGNRKPLVHPRGTIVPDTPLPEFAYFRTVGCFHALVAGVQAADGRTDLAVKTLFEAMTLADNMGHFLIIGSLVGASVENSVFRAFGELLPRLSRRDAVSIQHGVADLLARPSSIAVSIGTEADMTAAGVAVFLQSPSKPGFFGNDYPADGPLRKIPNMSAAARADLTRQVSAEIKAKSTAMLAILKRPERDWPAAFAQFDGETDTRSVDAAEELLHFLSPMYSGFAVTNVRTRTQLRLLALHARLVQYRWDYGRWPKTVDETDPLTGEKYDYSVADDGTVCLASRGLPETGAIELKYKRPPGTEKPEP